MPSDRPRFRRPEFNRPECKRPECNKPECKRPECKREGCKRGGLIAPKDRPVNRPMDMEYTPIHEVSSQFIKPQSGGLKDGLWGRWR